MGHLFILSTTFWSLSAPGGGAVMLFLLVIFGLSYLIYSWMMCSALGMAARLPLSFRSAVDSTKVSLSRSPFWLASRWTDHPRMKSFAPGICLFLGFPRSVTGPDNRTGVCSNSSLFDSLFHFRSVLMSYNPLA